MRLPAPAQIASFNLDRDAPTSSFAQKAVAGAAILNSDPTSGRATFVAMANRQHTWFVYHFAPRRKFIGIIEDAPDEHTAIARAIQKYAVPATEWGRLIALRRDTRL